MKRILKNADIPVLEFDLEEQYIRILNNDFLPYGMKDYIKTSDLSCMEGYKKSMKDMEILRDWLSGRVLNLSRTNAKQILNASSLPQSVKTEDRIRITLACNGLSMTDNFWITEETDKRTFSDVNLRNHHLGDAAYAISILGKNISVQRDILQPDIGTNGMFAKTWVRQEDSIFLWKTDTTSTFVNTRAELFASEILDSSDIFHISYEQIEKDGLIIASCPCICTDEISIVDGYELKDWCEHTGQDFLSTVMLIAKREIANMGVIDYIFGNTDRHLGNICFLVDNSTNLIISLAPLFDHNQSFICDLMGTDISDCIYELTGKTMKESALEFLPDAQFAMDFSLLPEKALKRAEEIGIYKEKEKKTEEQEEPGQNI